MTETKTNLRNPLSGLGKKYIVYEKGQPATGVAIVFDHVKMRTPTTMNDRYTIVHYNDNMAILGAYAPIDHSTEKNKLTSWNTIDDNIGKLVYVLSTGHCSTVLNDNNSNGAHMQAARSLDRIILKTNKAFEADTSLDWVTTVADHALVVADMKLNGNDRNIGRPHAKER